MKHATRQRSSRATSNSHANVGCRIRGRRTVTPRHLPIRHSHGRRRTSTSSSSSTPSRTHTSTSSVGGSSNTSASNSSSNTAEDAMQKLHADLNASRTPKTHRTHKSTTSTIVPSSHSSSTTTTTTTVCCTNTTSNNVNNISSGMSSLDEQDGDEGSSSSSSSEDGMRCRHHHHHYYYYQRIHSHSTTSSSSSTSASDASSERSTQSTESVCSQDDCVKYDDDDDACLYEDENNTQDVEEEEEDDKELTCALYRLPRAVFLHVCAFLDDAGCRVVLELSRTLHRQITSADDIVWRTLCLQGWSNKQGFRDFVARCRVQREQTYKDELRIFALQQQLLVQYYVDHDINVQQLSGTLSKEEGERCEGVEEKSEAEHDAVEQQQSQVNTNAADEAKTEQRHVEEEATLVSPTTPITIARKSVTIITHESNSQVNDATRRSTHDPSTHFINTNHYHVSHSHSQPRRSRRRRRPRRCHRSRGRSQRRGSHSVATRKRNHKHRANSTNRGHSRSQRNRSSRRGQTCKRPPPASARRRRRHRRRHRHWDCGHKTRTPTRDTTPGQYNARHHNDYYYDSDDEDEDNVYYSSRPHYAKHQQQQSRTRHPYERHTSSPTTTTSPTQVVRHYPHRSRSRTHRPANPRKPSQSARRRRRRQAQQRNLNNCTGNNKKKRKQPACCEVHTATYEAIQRTTVQERTARQLPPCPLVVCPALSSQTLKGKDNKEERGSSTATVAAGPCKLHWWQLAPDTRRELLLQRVQDTQQEPIKGEEEEEDIESQLSASAMDADDENEQPVHSRPRSTSTRTTSSTASSSSLSSCMSARQRALCLREVAMRVTQARSTQLYYSNSNSAKSGIVSPTPQTAQTTAQDTNDNAVKESDIHALVPVVSSSSAPPPPVMSWKFAYYMACREARRTRLSIQDLLDGIWLVCFRATGNVHPIYFHADQSLTMDKALFTFSPTSNEESSHSSSSALTLSTRAIRSVIQGPGVHPTTTTTTTTTTSADYMHASYVNSHGSHEAAPPPTISLRSLDDGSHQYAQRQLVTTSSSTLLHSNTTSNMSTTANSGGSGSIPAAAPPLPSLRYHLLQGGAQLVVHNFPPLQVIRRSGTTESELEEHGTEDTAHISVPTTTTTTVSSPSLTEPQASSLLDRVFADEPRRSLQLLYSGTQHTLTSSSQGVQSETMREVVQRLKDQGGLHVRGLFTQNTVDNNNTSTTTTSASMSSMDSTHNNFVHRDAAQVSARIAEDWGWTLSSNFVKIFSIELHTPLFVERLGRIAGLNITCPSKEDV